MCGVPAVDPMAGGSPDGTGVSGVCGTIGEMLVLGLNCGTGTGTGGTCAGAPTTDSSSNVNANGTTQNRNIAKILL
jgi:hypothetical protein